MQTLVGSNEGLWLVRQRQQELRNEAAQQRLASFRPITERQIFTARSFRAGSVLGAVALGQSQLAAVRQVVAPEPCPECADGAC